MAVLLVQIGCIADHLDWLPVVEEAKGEG